MDTSRLALSLILWPKCVQPGSSNTVHAGRREHLFTSCRLDRLVRLWHVFQRVSKCPLDPVDRCIVSHYLAPMGGSWTERVPAG